jgi:hypothetical protein
LNIAVQPVEWERVQRPDDPGSASSSEPAQPAGGVDNSAKMSGFILSRSWKT